MRANKGSDTAPELALRSTLHARGLRFRVNLRFKVNGTVVRPDIVFTRKRLAVFIDGCYWHGCPVYMSWPKQNAEFWRAKIEGNRRRDQRQDEALRRAGWTVVRIWEHQNVEDVLAKVLGALDGLVPSR